jgi:phospholipase C
MLAIRGRLGRCSVLVATVLLAACSPRAGGGPGAVPDIGLQSSARSGAPPRSPMMPYASMGKIQHVVIVVQENRSFDNLFQGFPGANTASSGVNSLGQTIPLQPVGLEVEYEVEHFVNDFLAACDGSPSGMGCTMDGFDLERAYGKQLAQNPQFAYVPQRETRLYFDVARQYVLGDDMFTSQIDASFPSHQYIIAGQAGDSANVPSQNWGCDGPKTDHVDTLQPDRTLGATERPCFNYRTIADELDGKSLPWRFYSVGPSNGNFAYSAYQAVKHIYRGPDWSKDAKWPPSRFLSDVAKGELAAVTWITPDQKSSDHPVPYAYPGKRGPEWVANVVNAVGESKFWDSTAIFVMWDDWGGWYDHVPPPYVDFDGLGFRVPLVVVSPYAKQGYVSHVQYEHGSILKFVEDTFGLSRLAASDTRANSPAADCFDFTQPPRPFVPFKTTLRPSDFINAPIDTEPIDEE